MATFSTALLFALVGAATGNQAVSKDMVRLSIGGDGSLTQPVSGKVIRHEAPPASIGADGKVEPLPGPSFWFYGDWVLQPPAIDLSRGSAIKLIPPSKTPYTNLLKPNATSWSQCGQDRTLEPILRQIGKGFFVESGAKDGEECSNTLFWEKQGWTGLLVEPSTKYFPPKNRNAYFFEGCISPTAYETTLSFQNGPGGTGHLDKFGSGAKEGGIVQVQAVPLHALLEAAGKQKTVDYWSLDVEGSEASILKVTDFKKVEVGVILVEMDHEAHDNLKGIQQVMDQDGFKEVGHSNTGCRDRIFVNPAYFAKRKLSLPTSTSLPVGNRGHQFNDKK